MSIQPPAGTARSAAASSAQSTAAERTAAQRTVPRQDSMAADTSMDAVTLLVADLDRLTRFYRDAIGLDVIERPAERLVEAARVDSVTLGRGTTPLVVLRHTPDLPPAQRGSAGLFHTAILFEDRAALAATLASVASVAPGSYTGSADHLVSLAFYLTDPEGNGVELYWDRDRSLWGWDDGQVRMGSLALDPNGFLAEHLSREPLPAARSGAVVGHVHLQVGDVPSARGFYVDTLGFDETLEYHGALFVSAGGYHHHLAMNTWNSAGAGPRASSLGLGEVALVVPTADDVAALDDRLRHHGVPRRHDGATLRFDDPWRNHLSVAAEG